jgi:predicted TIM-barrel fold metal-dependent hydrolase
MIELFDVQTGFGGAQPGVPKVIDTQEFQRVLDAASIQRALVRMLPDALDTDVVLSNAMLAQACAADPRLVPCPAVVPNTGGDLDDEERQVETAIANRAGAATLRPDRDAWLGEPWVCRRLLAALQARRLPALCSERQVTVPQLARFAAEYPSLPFILVDISYRWHRTYAALLAEFPNVRLSIGNNYAVSGGIEQFVRAAGPDRVLFGTGFPESEPMGAATFLLYADLPDEHKRMIGSGNMLELMEGIAR